MIRISKTHWAIVYLIAFILAFSAAIIVHSFFFDIYRVSSSSMENTVYSGDRVLVLKLNCDIMPNWSLKEGAYFSLGQIKSSTRFRNKVNDIRGNQYQNDSFNFKYSDIVVYKLTRGDENFFIKRVIALPGDSLSIEESEVFINGDLYTHPKNLKFKYQAFVASWDMLQNAINDSRLSHLRKHLVSIRNQESFLASRIDLELIQTLPCIDSIRRISENRKLGVRSSFHKDLDWSIDFFGPIKIPHRGCKIQINEVTLKIYRSLISTCEGIEIKQENGTFQIDGDIVTEYTFKNNYYFLLGDNRYMSVDSRYIGLIPEEMIIGSAKRILFSAYNGKIQYDRFFRKIY